MSPANVPANSSAPQNLNPADALRRKQSARAGAGSDTEALASDREGGAMSDASRRRTMLKFKNPTSPPPTDAASPASRPGSPGPATTPADVSAPFNLTEEDIRRLIGPDGMTTKDFLAKAPFAKDADKRKQFMQVVKNVAKFDKLSGRVTLKDPKA